MVTVNLFRLTTAGQVPVRTGRVDGSYSRRRERSCMAFGHIDTAAGAVIEKTSPLRDRDWLQGKLAAESINSIAADLGVTRQNVQYWIRRHHLDRRAPPPATVDVRRPGPGELARLYLEHGTAAELAARLGVTTATAARWCREAGVTMRPRGRPAVDADLEVWRRQRTAGWTNAKIAAAAGVATETVRNRLAHLDPPETPLAD